VLHARCRQRGTLLQSPPLDSRLIEWCCSPSCCLPGAQPAAHRLPDAPAAGRFCHIFLIELLLYYLTWTAVQRAVYLALSLPPIVFPTRQVLDFWLPGHIYKRPLLRKIFLIAVGTVLAMSCLQCHGNQWLRYKQERGQTDMVARAPAHSVNAVNAVFQCATLPPRRSSPSSCCSSGCLRPAALARCGEVPLFEQSLISQPSVWSPLSKHASPCIG